MYFRSYAFRLASVNFQFLNFAISTHNQEGLLRLTGKYEQGTKKEVGAITNLEDLTRAKQGLIITS